MSYLLDTCLLSEIWKVSPNPGVLEWVQGTIEEELHLSVLSLGEIRKGIDALADGKQKQRLIRDYGLLRSRFSTRILPITEIVAERWGEIAAAARRAGRTVHVVDGLIAATALVFGLTVVTRNVADFDPTLAPLENPWS